MLTSKLACSGLHRRDPERPHESMRTQRACEDVSCYYTFALLVESIEIYPTLHEYPPPALCAILKHFTPRLQFQAIPDLDGALSLKAFSISRPAAPNAFVSNMSLCCRHPRSEVFHLDISTCKLYVRSTKLTQLSCGINGAHQARLPSPST